MPPQHDLLQSRPKRQDEEIAEATHRSSSTSFHVIPEAAAGPGRRFVRASQLRRESFWVQFSKTQGPPQITGIMVLIAIGLGSTIGVVPSVMTDRFARLNHGYADDNPSCSVYQVNEKPEACFQGSADAQSAVSFSNLVSNGLTFLLSSLLGSLSDEHGRKGKNGQRDTDYWRFCRFVISPKGILKQLVHRRNLGGWISFEYIKSVDADLYPTFTENVPLVVLWVPRLHGVGELDRHSAFGAIRCVAALLASTWHWIVTRWILVRLFACSHTSVYAIKLLVVRDKFLRGSHGAASNNIRGTRDSPTERSPSGKGATRTTSNRRG